MQPRDRFIAALERRAPTPGQRVPHFELVFFLTMEAFGKVHPSHRNYRQWDQMEEKERELIATTWPMFSSPRPTVSRTTLSSSTRTLAMSRKPCAWSI